MIWRVAVRGGARHWMVRAQKGFVLKVREQVSPLCFVSVRAATRHAATTGHSHFSSVGRAVIGSHCNEKKAGRQFSDSPVKCELHCPGCSEVFRDLGVALLHMCIRGGGSNGAKFSPCKKG